MRRVRAIVLLAGSLGGCDKAGPPADRAAIESRIDAIFADYDRADAPGCAVGVYRAGELLFAKGYGIASIEHGLPITPETNFDIGSVSKQFTALAVLMLERDGRLSLTDDVRRYLPELPDYGTPITVRDLLYHTSGIRGYPALEVLSTRPVDTTEQLLSLLANQRALNFAPGSMHEYSHSDYELLGLVVERATGEPFGPFLEREVLQRLGMNGSRVHDARRVPIPNRAFAYSQSDHGYAMRFPNDEVVGGTGLYVNVMDLLHWDRNFHDGALGTLDLVNRMHERPRLASGDSIPYAYGLYHGEYRGLPIVSRSGGGGFATELMRFPDQRFAVATLCNTESAHPLYHSRAVAEVFLGDAMQPLALETTVAVDSAAPPQAELARYAGIYRPLETRWNLLQLEVRDGRLWEVFPDTAVALARLQDGRYAAGGLYYTFTRASPAAPLRLQLSTEQDPHPELLDQWPESERWRPNAAALAEYAGSYYSADLDTRWELATTDGGLGLRRTGAPDVRLHPVTTGVFTQMLGTFVDPVYIGIQFRRDASGAIAHFELETPPGIDALRRLRFDRITWSR